MWPSQGHLHPLTPNPLHFLLPQVNLYASVLCSLDKPLPPSCHWLQLLAKSLLGPQTYLQKLQKMEKSPRIMLARDKALTTSFQVNSFIWGWLCSLVRKKLLHSPGAQERGSWGCQGQRVPKEAPRDQVPPVPLDLTPELHPPNIISLAGMKETTGWRRRPGGETKVLKMNAWESSVAKWVNHSYESWPQPPPVSDYTSWLTAQTSLQPIQWPSWDPHGPGSKGYGPFPNLRDKPLFIKTFIINEPPLFLHYKVSKC